MNIFLTLDSNYIYPLCVLLRSIATTNPDGDFDFYVAYSSLTEKDFEAMEEALGKVSHRLHRIYVDDAMFSAAPILERTSKATYYRLLAGEILPENVHKILYLDPDVVIKKDLSEFYNTDISDYAVAGGTHLYGFAQKINLLRLGMKKTSDYINAGILLINLDNWRKVTDLNGIITFISENFKKLVLADQDVINVIFEDHMLRIDERRYNLDEKTFRVHAKKSAGNKRIDLDWVEKNTTVIHYNGKHKPWLEKNYGGKLGEYFERYKNT